MDGIVSIQLELDRSNFDKAIADIQKNSYDVFANLQLDTKAFDKQMSEVMRGGYDVFASLKLDTGEFEKSIREELNKGYQLDVVAQLDTRQFTQQLDEILKPREVRVKAILDSEDLERQLGGYEVKVNGKGGTGTAKGKEDCCDKLLDKFDELIDATESVKDHIGELRDIAKTQFEMPNVAQELSKAIKAIASPFKSVITGFLEGIGDTIATPLTKGALKSAEAKTGKNLEDIGEKVADGVLKSWGKSTKNAPKKATPKSLDDVGVDIATKIATTLIEKLSGNFNFIVSPILEALDFESQLKDVLRDRTIDVRARVVEDTPFNPPPQREKEYAEATPEPQTTTADNPFAQIKPPPRPQTVADPWGVQPSPPIDNFNRMVENIEKSSGLFQQTKGGVKTATGSAIASLKKSGVDAEAAKTILLQLTKASDAARSLVQRYQELQAIGKEIIKQDPSRKGEIEGKLQTIGAKGVLARKFTESYGVEQTGKGYEVTGRAVIEGLKKSTKGQAGTVGSQIAAELSEGTQRKLGIKSPSRVFMGIGRYAVQGLDLGIKSLLGTVAGDGIAIAKTLYSSVVDFLQIKSPSKRFFKLGKDAILGLNLGLSKDLKTKPIVDQFNALFEALKPGQLQELLNVKAPDLKLDKQAELLKHLHKKQGTIKAPQLADKEIQDFTRKIARVLEFGSQIKLNKPIRVLINPELNKQGINGLQSQFNDESIITLGRNVKSSKDLLKDKALLTTLIHEIRHALQREIIGKFNRYESQGIKNLQKSTDLVDLTNAQKSSVEDLKPRVEASVEGGLGNYDTLEKAYKTLNPNISKGKAADVLRLLEEDAYVYSHELVDKIGELLESVFEVPEIPKPQAIKNQKLLNPVKEGFNKEFSWLERAKNLFNKGIGNLKERFQNIPKLNLKFKSLQDAISSTTQKVIDGMGDRITNIKDSIKSAFSKLFSKNKEIPLHIPTKHIEVEPDQAVRVKPALENPIIDIDATRIKDELAKQVNGQLKDNKIDEPVAPKKDEMADYQMINSRIKPLQTRYYDKGGSISSILNFTTPWLNIARALGLNGRLNKELNQLTRSYLPEQISKMQGRKATLEKQRSQILEEVRKQGGGIENAGAGTKEALKMLGAEINKITYQLNSIPVLQHELKQLEERRRDIQAQGGSTGGIDSDIQGLKTKIQNKLKRVDELNEDLLNTSGAVQRRTSKLLGVARNFFMQKMLPDNVPYEVKDEATKQIVSTGFAAVSAFAPLTTIGALISPLLLQFAELGVALAGINSMFGGIIRELANTLSILEPITIRFSTIAGSKQGGQDQMNFATDMAKKYNLPIEGTVRQFSQLAGAAMNTVMEGQPLRDFFEGISVALSSMGLSAQDAELAMLAFQQLLSKGKISAEEIRQQLGERFPIAMTVFSQALGVSISEFNHLMESGALASADVLPKVGKLMKDKFAQGAKDAANTFTAAMVRMQNALFNFKKEALSATAFGASSTLGQSIVGVTSFAASLVEKLSGLAVPLTQIGAAVGLGFGIQLIVGIFQVVKNIPIANKVATLAQGIATQAVKSTIIGLTPFMAGVLADVADNWFGAKNSVFDNMAGGFTQLFTAVFGQLDILMRNVSGKSLFPVEAVKRDGKSFLDTVKGVIGSTLNIFVPLGAIATGITALFAPQVALVIGATTVIAALAGTLTNMFSSIPSGLVEMGAIVLMLTQVAALGKLYLIPMLGNLWNTVVSLGTGFKTAIASGQGLKAIFNDLRLGATLLQGAIYAAFAVAIVALARSDFSNTLGSQMDKLDKQILSNAQNIEDSFKRIADAQKIAIAEMSSNRGIPEKGLELNPAVWLGISEENFNADKNRLNSRKENLEYLQKEAQKRGKSIDQVDYYGLRINTKARDEFKSFGINNVTPVTGGVFENGLTLGEEQLLNNLKDQQRMQGVVKDNLAKSNLIGGKFGSFWDAPGLKTSFAAITEIENKVMNLSSRRASLVPINTKEARKQIDEIDAEIKRLSDERATKGKPLIDIAGDVEASYKALQDKIKAIQDDPNYSAEVKQALINQVRPQLEMYAQASEFLKAQGIANIADQMGYSWDKFASAIEKAKVALEKFNQQIELKGLKSQLNLQERINRGELSQGKASAIATENELNQLQEKATFQENHLKILQDSYYKLSTIPFTSQEQKKELEDIRKDILSGETDLAKSRLDIAQKYGEQRKQIEEKTLNDIERANNKTLTTIEQRQASNLTPVFGKLSQGGYWDEARADFEINQIKRDAATETTRAAIANTQQQMSAYRKLRNQGIIDETSYKDKMLALNKDLASQSVQLLEQQLEAQKARIDEFLRHVQSQYDENIRGLRFKLGAQLNQGLAPNQAELSDLLGQIEQTEKAIAKIQNRPNQDKMRSQSINSQLSTLEGQKQKLISRAISGSIGIEDLGKLGQELGKLSDAIAPLEQQKASLNPLKATQKEREELRKLEAQLTTLKNNYLNVVVAQREFQIGMETQGRSRSFKGLELHLTDEEMAVKRLESERQTNTETLNLRKYQLKELDKLNKNKFFSDNQYAEKRRGILEQINQLETTSIDNSVELEKARLKAIEALRTREMEILGKMQDIRSKNIDLQTQELDRTKQLKEAFKETYARRNELIQQGLTQQQDAIAKLKESQSALKELPERRKELKKDDIGGREALKREEDFLKARRDRLSGLLGLPGMGYNPPDWMLNEKQRELEAKLAQEKLNALQQELVIQREMLALEQESARLSAEKAAQEAEVAKAKSDQNVQIILEKLNRAKLPEERARLQDDLAIAIGERQIADKSYEAAKSYYEKLQQIQQRQAYNQGLQGQQQYQQAGLDVINTNPYALSGFKLNAGIPQFVELPTQKYQPILNQKPADLSGYMRYQPQIKAPSMQIESRSQQWRGEIEAAIKNVQPAIGNLEINNNINRPDNVDDAALARRLSAQTVKDFKDALSMAGY